MKNDSVLSSSPKKRTYPVILMNYRPRIIACTFYLLAGISELRWELLDFQYIWIIFGSLGWPHLAYQASVRSKNQKRQELINMHLDAFVSTIIVFSFPSYDVITITMILLVSNSMFVGSFKLLGTTGLVIVTTILMTNLVISIEIVEFANLSTRYLAFSFGIVYFIYSSYLGHSLASRLISVNREIKELSTQDSLTQSFNRRYLDSNLDREIHRCERFNQPLTVIFADLDGFKTINDSYGHSFGDDILKQFVIICDSCIREDVDWIARFGGEEFILVLPNLTQNGGVDLANRIRTKLSDNPFIKNGINIKVTCSFGVSCYEPKDNFSSEKLLKIADKALYQAKNNGRDRVEVGLINEVN